MPLARPRRLPAFDVHDATGIVHLTAAVDWAGRLVPAHQAALPWRARAVIALELAFAKYGTPQIVKSPQGFAGTALTEVVPSCRIGLSMDSKGNRGYNVLAPLHLIKTVLLYSRSPREH